MGCLMRWGIEDEYKVEHESSDRCALRVAGHLLLVTCYGLQVARYAGKSDQSVIPAPLIPNLKSSVLYLLSSVI